MTIQAETSGAGGATPAIFDMDIGSDPDDTCVATMVLGAADRFRPALLLTNDETSTLGRARFLASLVDASGLDVPVAAGLPSERRRADCLVEEVGLCPADPRFERDGVELLIRTLEAHPRVDYFSLGALTNLDAALEARPELASRVRLVQMGPALQGAYHRDWPQYNARLDPGAFVRALRRVERPTLVMSHSTWGTYGASTRQKLGVYLDDPMTAALRSASPVAALFLRHLEAWVADGMPCTILHDPLTVLASLTPGLVDFVDARLALGGDGWTWLDEGSHLALRGMLPHRARPISGYLQAPPRPVEGALSIACSLSLDTHDEEARRAIATALVGERGADVAADWGAFNRARDE
jgi:inosine-uridine nucleoside N-ribohydrolase